MKHYGLIGEKLGHSLSVPIHEEIFRLMGIDADYTLIEIPRDELDQRLPELIQSYDGLNVTIPYKTDVFRHVDVLDATATQAQSANTICARAAYNPDMYGFQAMLSLHHMQVKGQKCYILGSGGAAKGVAAALGNLSCAGVTMVSRTPGDRLGHRVISYEDLPGEFEGLLVNCTPVGMYPKPDACPLSKDALDVILKKAYGVADLIYNPLETQLLRAARDHGVPACNGLTMLVAQAMEAERIWQNQQIPEDVLRPEFLESLERMLPSS